MKKKSKSKSAAAGKVPRAVRGLEDNPMLSDIAFDGAAGMEFTAHGVRWGIVEFKVYSEDSPREIYARVIPVKARHLNEQAGKKYNVDWFISTKTEGDLAYKVNPCGIWDCHLRHSPGTRFGDAVKSSIGVLAEIMVVSAAANPAMYAQQVAKALEFMAGDGVRP